MSHYRKRPIEIEAMQFLGVSNYHEILAWMGRTGPRWQGDPEGVLIIVTLEGEMTALPNDYIIRGIEGEYYPCKPAIFEKTYESIPPPAVEPLCSMCNDRGFYTIPQAYECNCNNGTAA